MLLFLSPVHTARNFAVRLIFHNKQTQTNTNKQKKTPLTKSTNQKPSEERFVCVFVKKKELSLFK